jgi:hypothetical protein
MDALPHWDDGTVAILSTGGGPPHAIPVSTAVRGGDHMIVLALARRRESLARLRAEPRVALTLLGPDVACTAHAIATIAEEPLAEADAVIAVRLDVDDLQDHRQPTFTLDDGVRWHWTDDTARERDTVVRRGLERIARAGS